MEELYLQTLGFPEINLLRLYDSMMWQLSKMDNEPNSHVISLNDTWCASSSNRDPSNAPVPLSPVLSADLLAVPQF